MLNLGCADVHYQCTGLRGFARGADGPSGQSGRRTAVFLTTVVIVTVSAALVAGAAWGAYGRLPAELEGFMVALAGRVLCSRQR